MLRRPGSVDSVGRRCFNRENGLISVEKRCYHRGDSTVGREIRQKTKRICLSQVPVIGSRFLSSDEKKKCVQEKMLGSGEDREWSDSCS